jgi:hypothetical protein
LKCRHCDKKVERHGSTESSSVEVPMRVGLLCRLRWWLC